MKGADHARKRADPPLGGVAGALLARLIEERTTRGFRLMVAVIGDSGNAASIGLHAAQGFAMVGNIPAIGGSTAAGWTACR